MLGQRAGFCDHCNRRSNDLRPKHGRPIEHAPLVCSSCYYKLLDAPTHADRIPLSELRWWRHYIAESPHYDDCTRRGKLELAVSLARCERLDCVANPVLTEQEMVEEMAR